MSDLSNDTKKHTTKSRETIPLKRQYHDDTFILEKYRTSRDVRVNCWPFNNFDNKLHLYKICLSSQINLAHLNFLFTWFSRFLMFVYYQVNHMYEYMRGVMTQKLRVRFRVIYIWRILIVWGCHCVYCCKLVLHFARSHDNLDNLA
jgi:hypothetical protein